MALQEAPSSPEGPDVPREDFGFLVVPRRLSCTSSHPYHFGTGTKIGFGVGCALVVANLCYCQPLLIQISEDFKTSYTDVSVVPTMYQVGYAVGLCFITPLGDLVRRRQLIIGLVFVTTCLSVGIALSKSILVLKILSLLLGVFNVTPQILIPFAADLASPEHRAGAVSVLQSGLMLGMLLSRVFSGVVAYFSNWRVVYYAAIGLQLVVLFGAYLVVPDHPPRNPRLSYHGVFLTMARYAVTEPKLVQAVFINMASIACWSSFWTTVSFLLGDPPYNYSMMVTGLFGLVGALGVFAGPVVGRFIDRTGPWISLLVATTCLLLLQSIETAAAGINIAAVVIFGFGLDALRQTQTVSLQTIVFSISADSRSRLNAVLTLSLSAGQAIGTSAGSEVFLKYGWRMAGAFSMALYGWQLFVLFLRGPNCQQYTWFGYEGGFTRGGKQNETTIQSDTQISSVIDISASNSNQKNDKDLDMNDSDITLTLPEIPYLSPGTDLSRDSRRSTVELIV